MKKSFVYLNIILTVTALFFTFEFLKSVIWFFDALFQDSYLRRYLLWFIAGGGLYWIVFCVLWRKYLSLIQTSVHEWLHTFACMIMFRDVQAITASSDNGGVMFHSGNSNLFISLTPYTLPILAYGAFFIVSFFPGRMAWVYAIPGFFFFLHVHAFVRQTSIRQPDLQCNGLYMSVVYIATILSMNLAICLYSAGLRLGPGIRHFFSVTWHDFAGFFTSLLNI